MSPWPRRLALHGLFLATALLIFWGRWQGRSPFIYLGVDAGRVATNAAMCDYPENFRWLAVRKLGVLCVHPHVFLVNGVRLLENVVGDFGTATVVLLVPVVFLQLWGFFLVGRVLFGEDKWALALTFLQLPLVWIRYPVGTHWGIYEDPWARHLYQAVLPFLLWAALKFVDRPSMWPWVLLANGVALYFHWRNGFGWMLALGSGFLAVLPKVMPERRRWWRVLAGMGLAAVLLLLPPLWYYRGVFLQLLQREPASPALMALVARLQWEYVQYVVAAPLLLTVYSVLLPRLPVLVLALLGLWAVRRLPDARLRLQWRMVQVWGVVLLLHAVALHLVPPRFSTTVFHMYFLRNVRFLIPLALLFAVAFLVYWAQGHLPRSSVASWATWGGAWVPVTALAVFPITLQVQGWRPVERFLNLRAVDLTLRVMARVSDPDSVLWTRPYFRLALQTALDDLLFVVVLLVVLGVLAFIWRAPLWKPSAFAAGWQRWSDRRPQAWAAASLAAMSILWVWGHAEGGAVALFKTALQTPLRLPAPNAFQKLYAQAIPQYVPPKTGVFTTDPYPWEIGYISLRNAYGGTSLRRIVRWNMRNVQDPEQRAKVWLALARKHRAQYMVTVDIPAEVWRRFDAVQVLYGQDTAVLLRIVATSFKEER